MKISHIKFKISILKYTSNIAIKVIPAYILKVNKVISVYTNNLFGSFFLFNIL